VSWLWALWAACAPTEAPDPVDVAWGVVQAQRPLLHALEASLVPPEEPTEPSDEGLSRSEGVTRAHGQAVLDGVRAEYRAPIDEKAWAAAASEALGVEAAERPEEAIQRAIDGGRPEPVAVVIGVEAALAELDPYTRAIWPAELAGWEQHHAGVVVGVGLEVDELVAGQVHVTTVWPQGPAFEAGVRQGERLVAVDDQPVTDLRQARAVLAGAPDTPARLGLVSGETERSVAVPRREVAVPTVTGWNRRDDHGYDLELPWGEGLVYVRLSAFRSDTDEALLGLLESHGRVPRGIVLDLRGNGGGDVQAAVNVVDAWLDEGTVATMEGLRAPRPEPPEPGVLAWNQAAPGGPAVGVPTVVLVDQGTASAAEIVAGALQQLAGAHVIGAPTLGKGSSQALRGDASLGVGWQVTNLAWALPSGQVLVHGQGVQPDERLVPSLGERWQVRHMAQVREHPTVHADGSEQVWLGSSVRPELPVLAADPGVVAAARWLLR
jgi:carboxyl-terminal processing protease